MKLIFFLLFWIMATPTPSDDVVQQLTLISNQYLTEIEQGNQSVFQPNLTEEEKNEIAYWNELAVQYGVQTYSPVNGPLESYIEYMQGVINETAGYEAYFEDEDGVLIQNPIYENRFGPSDEEYYSEEYHYEDGGYYTEEYNEPW